MQYKYIRTPSINALHQCRSIHIQDFGIFYFSDISANLSDNSLPVNVDQNSCIDPNVDQLRRIDRLGALI